MSLIDEKLKILEELEHFNPKTLEEYFKNISKISSCYNRCSIEEDLISIYKNIKQVKTKLNYVKTFSHKYDNLKNEKLIIPLENTVNNGKYYLKNFRILGLTDPNKYIISVNLATHNDSLTKFLPRQKQFITNVLPFTNDLEYIPRTIIFSKENVTYEFTNNKMNGYQIPLFNSFNSFNSLIKSTDDKYSLFIEFKNIYDINEIKIEYDLYEEEINKEEINKEEINKEQINKEQINKEMIIFNQQTTGDELFYSRNNTYNLQFNYPIFFYGINIFDKNKNRFNIKDTIKCIDLQIDNFSIHISSELLNTFYEIYGNNIIPLIEKFTYDNIIHNSLNSSKMNLNITLYIKDDIYNNLLIDINTINANIYGKFDYSYFYLKYHG